MNSRIIAFVVLTFAVLGSNVLLGVAPIAHTKQVATVPKNSPKIATPNDKLVPVTRVVDGDTIVVLENGVREKVRLIGVNTPETVDPRRPVQCFGREASAFTKRILADQNVHLEADPTQGDRDKYGRLLRYVFLTDGTLVNEIIISQGYGYEYTYHIPYRYQKDFKNAEHAARIEQKGLWAPFACAH